MKHRRGLVTLGLLVALLGGAWWALASTGVSGVDPGRPIPNLVLPDLAGRPESLGAFRGRPLVVRFSSVACQLCSDDWGQLAAYQAGSDGRFQIVAIELGASAAVVRDTLAGRSIPIPVLIDSREASYRAFGLHGLPSYAFVAADGRLVALVAATNRATELSPADWSYYLGRMLAGR